LKRENKTLQDAHYHTRGGLYMRLETSADLQKRLIGLLASGGRLAVVVYKEAAN